MIENLGKVKGAYGLDPEIYKRDIGHDRATQALTETSPSEEHVYQV